MNNGKLMIGFGALLIFATIMLALGSWLDGALLIVFALIAVVLMIGGFMASRGLTYNS